MIHLYFINTNSFSSEISHFEDLLSTTEREKLIEFRGQRAIAFAVTHGWLRKLLSEMIGQDTSRIEFQFNSYGKPCLPMNFIKIFFNISYSDEFSLIALSPDIPVGVDLEKIKTFEYESIVSRLFHPNEYKSIYERPATDRLKKFYEIWTRKEAYLKATGEGLTKELSSFDATQRIINGSIKVTTLLYKNCSIALGYQSTKCDDSEFNAEFKLLEIEEKTITSV